MRLETDRGARRFLAQGAGVALMAALLAACGGGGGGGGSSGTPAGATGTTGTGGTSVTGPTATGPGGGTSSCAATQGTAANGLALGVCFSRDATLNTTVFDIGHRDLAGSDTAVTVVNFAAKNYAITLPGLLPSPVSFAATDENPCANLLGDKSGLLLEVPNNPGNSPSTTLLSFTQGYGSITAGQLGCTISKTGRPTPEIALSVFDFGTWERFAGGNALFYSGWYARRPDAAAAVPPTGSVTFGASRPGVAVGYLFSALDALGTSATVRNATFNAATRTVSGTLDTFQRNRQGLAAVASVQIESVSFSNIPVAANGDFDGPLNGTGNVVPSNTSTPIPASVTGRIKGTVLAANGGAGPAEMAARFQATLTAQGAAAANGRATGAFAIVP